jgi:ABC-2 type transport system permease protein
MVFFTIYSNVEAINGWGKYQVMFFLGTFFIVDSLAMVTYFFGVLSISENIRTGKLDIYMTKPINTLFYISMSTFEFGFVLNILYGIAIVAYSWARLGIALSISKVIGYIALTMAMYLLYYTIMLVVNSAAFWFVKMRSLRELHNQLFNFTYRVPGVVYKGIMKVIFLAIIPYGLIATVPTQFVTANMSLEFWLMTIGACFAYWFLALFIWKKGLKRYNSASS